MARALVYWRAQSPVLAGIVLMLLPPSDLGGTFGLVLGMSLLGAVMGVWVSGMIGASTPSTHLEAFSDEIARGQVLLIVDIPRARKEEISRMVRKHHPEVRVQAGAMPSPLR